MAGEGACSVTETDRGGHGPETVRTGTGNEASRGGEGPTENGYPLPAGLTQGPSPNSSRHSLCCKYLGLAMQLFISVNDKRI